MYSVIFFPTYMYRPICCFVFFKFFKNDYKNYGVYMKNMGNLILNSFSLHTETSSLFWIELVSLSIWLLQA